MGMIAIIIIIMTLKMQQPLFDNRMNFTDANFKLSQTIYK